MQINFEQTRLQTRGRRSSSRACVKDYFRNAPLLDFMAPTLTVRQIVTPNVVDDVNFARVAKMDRCTTCHLAIDRARLREVSAAVPDAPQPAGLCRQRLAASDVDDGMHGLPSGTGRFDQLPRRVALSGQCEAAAGVGREVSLARAAHVGLPDAADQHDGSVVRAVPPSGSLRAERAEAGRRVRDLRARRAVMRVTRPGASRTCASPARS